MRPITIQRRTGLNAFILLQLKDIIKEIEDLHLGVLLALLAFNQVIPDFDNMVAIINMPINKRVLARFQSSH
jgi:hypothetical protein